VIGDRWWNLRQSYKASVGLLKRVVPLVEQDRLPEALALCERGGGHLAAVLGAGLRELLDPRLGGSAAALTAREAMQRATAAEIERLERRLPSLATLGNISPFVGLFGTVIGVMRAFEAISRTGSGGLATVSAGIAEALVATAAGLFVAIPAVSGYNHFVSKVKAAATEMDAAASELLGADQRRAGREVGHAPVA
jgi:biopolymer transport protein ExbB/TolQ